MMASPEEYYEYFLKDKSENEIRSIIRGLKNKIGHLKNVMEHPEYGNGFMVNPSEDVQIICNREYLETAKKALTEIGATYQPSKSEIKAEQIQENLFNLGKIEFTIGGIFGGYSTYTVDLTGDIVLASRVTTFSKEATSHFIGAYDKPYMTQHFLSFLYDLHIGEWRSNYSTNRFGYVTLDGTEWKIEFHFNNGLKPIKFSGQNSYPYNFDRFCEYLCVEI